MSYSPILIVHICAGSLGLLSGTRCHVFPQWFPPPCAGGKVFVASLFTMGALAVYLAIVRHQPNNIGGGILTFYLIGTAWLTPCAETGKRAVLMGCAPDSLRQVIVRSGSQKSNTLSQGSCTTARLCPPRIHWPNLAIPSKLSNDRVKSST